jgi:hypothetical protein
MTMAWADVAYRRGGRRLRPGRLARLVGALLLVAAAISVASASARAADCSATGDFDYNGACGPEFESPAWGDAAGWAEPSKYSTIQLADITGNGKDELIGRNDDGLEIWTFDTTLGQWRPAMNANDRPEVLRDFRSPLPNEDVRGSAEDPSIYRTIQTADLDGNGQSEIIADFPDGVHVYRYTPPAGTKDINGGTWSLENVSGPSSNQLAPAQYESLHIIEPHDGIPAVLVMQNAYWLWGGQSGWQGTGKTTLAPYETDPKYYLDNQVGEVGYNVDNGTRAVFGPVDVFRTADGVAYQYYDNSGWHYAGLPPSQAGPCGSPDYKCSPFPDSSSFGDSPSYYETLHLADLGENFVLLLGRQRNGVQSYSEGWSEDTAGGPVLPHWLPSGVPAFAAGDPTTIPPGRWGSIRTGYPVPNDEKAILWLDGSRLQAWTTNGYLNDGAALKLGGSMWDNDSSYYSTIQFGPVAGPGYPDAVIARGPFGIRTWFYDLHGQSGWTSWLPQDTSSYPQLSGGEGAAWNELNSKAAQAALIGQGQTVRSIWTGNDAPTAKDLDDLQAGLLVFANCTDETSANPPTYGTCKAPAGSSGFTDDEWKAAVNEAFKEIYDAGRGLDFFSTLDKLRQDTFLAKEAELPAIGDSVKALVPEAGNGSEISPSALWSAGLGIAGAIGGFLNPAVGVALGIASYIAGIVPSATDDVTAPPFYGTLNQLEIRLADDVTQATKALGEQNYEVRNNWNMLQLVTELTAPTGPWFKIDESGLLSSMNEGFALWAYKQLLPTVLDRYVITGCKGETEEPGNTDCFFSGFTGGIGTPPSFTYFTSPHSTGTGDYDSWPCWWTVLSGIICHYTAPPSSTIATQVWGPLSDTCNNSGQHIAEWTFDCNLGINPALSTDLVGGTANGWLFTTCTGSPAVIIVSSDDARGSCSPAASASLGSDGSMQLTASVGLPASFHVTSATLMSNDLLYAPGGGGELVRRNAHHGLGAIRLTTGGGKLRGGSGGELGSPQGDPPVTLAVAQTANHEPKLTLSLSRVDVGLPDACQALPASISMATQPFVLQTALALSNGHTTHTVSLPATWTCVRNAAGVVTGLRTVTPPSPAQRPGLAVSVTGQPHIVTPGSNITYTIRLRNTRSGPSNRDVSSLWNVSARTALAPGGRPRAINVHFPSVAVRQIAELRRGTTRTLRVTFHVPANLVKASIRQVCVAVLAMAASARDATVRTCSSVASPSQGVAPHRTRERLASARRS